MNYDLCFDPAAYEVRQTELEGVSARYRAFEGIPYCAAPVDPIQKLNLYVPEDYYAGAQHNGYTLHTAPIFLSIGMHCLGCPSSRGETVEEACMVHGVDCEPFLAQLNNFLEAYEANEAAKQNG